MLKKYMELFTGNNFDYEDIFDEEATMTINGYTNFSKINQIRTYYESIKKELSDIQYNIGDIFIETEQGISFIWNLTAKHTGIYLGNLPTQKTLHFQVMTTLLLRNKKITKISLFFDSKMIEAQICNSSEKIFNASEISNDLNGPAKNIYQLLLSTRSTLTDSKQILVNALRQSTLRSPDLTLLNHEMIAELKAKTILTKTKIPLTHHETDVFIYTPFGEENNPNLPTILYLHGGGWCIGSPENYDNTNRKLALAAQARIVCPRYRLCPEHPYPAGFDDCCEVYLYCRQLPHNNQFFINPEKIIVAGDSVGGTLSAGLILRMQEEGKSLPNAAMLLSPATDMRLENYRSYNEGTRNNIMIDQGLIGFIRGCYIQGDMWDHPYVSPMRGELISFPKTFMMIGEADPLFDENIAFSQKISEQSQHKCDVLIGKSMPHHYHTFIGLADEVEEAYQRITTFLKGV